MTAGHPQREYDVFRRAHGHLLAGFNGVTAPQWLLQAVADGLAGVTLFQHNMTSVEQVLQLTDTLHAQRPGVIIACDEEGGAVSRLTTIVDAHLPGNGSLGTADDPDLTYQVGKALAELLHSLGINLNYAPCADINSNPNNPVIGPRSFGHTSELVAQHCAAFIRGHLDGLVACSAKHFPGHGDTSIDSHYELPTLRRDLQFLETRELVPFRAAIAAGVPAIMTGHLAVPEISPLPASLSPAWTDLLRNTLDFQGVIITDGLDMKAVSAPHGIADAARKAILAKADLLCLGTTQGTDDEAAFRSALQGVMAQLSQQPNDRLNDVKPLLFSPDEAHHRTVADRVTTVHRKASSVTELGNQALLNISRLGR